MRIAHCVEEKERFTAQGFTMLPQNLNEQSPQCVFVCVRECESVGGWVCERESECVRVCLCECVSV